MSSGKLSKKVSRVLIYMAVLLLLFFTLAPMAWMFISSITQGFELLSMPPNWIPKNPTFNRYISIFVSEQQQPGSLVGTASNFTRGLLNSLFVASVTTTICLILGMLSSYAIARLRFKGKNALLLSIMALQMVPAIATIIPLFFLIRITGLTDKPVALIITYSGFTITYIVWVMTGYINNLPIELEEAALIDGCSPLRALVTVTLPLAIPGLVAVGTFSFLTAWNEFFICSDVHAQCNRKNAARSDL
jgi:multiple sugar transport system permease protein